MTPRLVIQSTSCQNRRREFGSGNDDDMDKLQDAIAKRYVLVCIALAL
jgi:hypothetical protein